MEKTIIVDIDIERQKFHQYERPISIKNKDVNKIVVFNKVFLAKKVLNISSVIKMVKKIDRYTCFIQKWVHIEETLMKLNICLFW